MTKYSLSQQIGGPRDLVLPPLGGHVLSRYCTSNRWCIVNSLLIVHSLPYLILIQFLTLHPESVCVFALISGREGGYILCLSQAACL